MMDDAAYSMAGWTQPLCGCVRWLARPAGCGRTSHSHRSHRCVLAGCPDQSINRPTDRTHTPHTSPQARGPKHHIPAHQPAADMADSGSSGGGGGGKKPSGALNVERRTWDVEHFQKVAKEKLERVRGSVCVSVCVASGVVCLLGRRVGLGGPRSGRRR